MTFKMRKDESTPEQLEIDQIGQLTREQRRKLQNRESSIKITAAGFYESWFRDDPPVSRQEAEQALDKAWMAAEVLRDGLEARSNPAFEED